MKKTLAAAPQIDALLMLLDEAYDKPAWHGPNFRGSIRRVDAAQAIWRPEPQRKHLGDHGSRGVLEICRAQAAHRAEAGLFSAGWFQLVCA